MTTTQHNLILSHADRACAVGRRYGRAYRWLADDCVSAALTGLCEAAMRYRPEQGEFWHFARVRVLGAVQDVCRRELPFGTRRNKRLLPVLPASSCPTIEDAVNRTPDWRSPVGWEMEWEDELNRFCRFLPKRTAVLVRGYYSRAGVCARQLSREVGISESRVSMLLTEARKTLRKAVSGG